MAASLIALLSQQTPCLQTRRGLLILGLQNDFISPDGKLPVNVPSGFWHSMRDLVPAFREFGDVIWVRSEYDSERGANSNSDDDAGADIIVSTAAPSEASETRSIGEKDKIDGERASPVPSKRRRVSEDQTACSSTSAVVEPVLPYSTRHSSECFLSKREDGEVCCQRGSKGAQLCAEADDLVKRDTDIVATTTNYSSFGAGSLLLTLRSKLITELFICGCPTNSSVYATAMDAARYGLQINLIEDCLLARSKELNDLTIKRLCEVLEADVMTSAKTIDFLRNPPPDFDVSEDEESEYECTYEGIEADDDLEEEEEDDLTLPLGYLRNTERATAPPAPSHLLLDGLEDLQFSSTAVHEPLESESVAQMWTPDPKPSANQSYKPPQEAPQQPSEEVTPPNPESKLINPSPMTHRKQGRSHSETSPALPCWTGNESHSRLSIEAFMKQSREARVSSTAASKHPGLNAFAAICNLNQKTVSEYENMMAQATTSSSSSANAGDDPAATTTLSPPPTTHSQPLFGTGRETESAGSTITYSLLPPDLAETIFSRLKAEITWQNMYHQTGSVPRLVACQGTIDPHDGSRPVYRHPSDRTLPLDPWTPAVEEVRRIAEEHVGHVLNHVLVQMYRDRTDFISEHSDKTLDIVPGSRIVNVSFGAERVMRLRTKRGGRRISDSEMVGGREAELQPPPPTLSSSSSSAPAGDPPTPTNAIPPPQQRTTHRLPLPHNSLLQMSLATNATYLHSIPADKRLPVELSAAEKAYEGSRISLTFRHIGTFLNSDGSRIWGQGARGKRKGDAGEVVNGHERESGRLLKGFGAENGSFRLPWEWEGEGFYGEGSDVLHLK